MTRKSLLIVAAALLAALDALPRARPSRASSR